MVSVQRGCPGILRPRKPRSTLKKGRQAYTQHQQKSSRGPGLLSPASACDVAPSKWPWLRRCAWWSCTYGKLALL